ncbi:MATE family efflux transporter [Klebsiella pneumoniae]|uniref:MATE family efflux transporter n=1 Tax=Klebsiella pneumoniae TaxID=573 RepID=UPI00359C396B
MGNLKLTKNKLIVQNTAFLATRTIVSLGVSFYTTRVILNTLGVSDYGVFSVIYGVVAFFVFIVSSLNDSVQRYLSISLGEKDNQQVKNVVKNSLAIYVFASLIFCLILYFMKSTVFIHVISIPTDRLTIASDIYNIALISIFITIIQTPFNAIVLAHEKMSFYAYMSICDALAKLSVAYLLMLITGDKLKVYSVLLLLSTMFIFFCYIFFCFIKFSYVFKTGKFSLKLLKEISLFSFWNVFGNFAYVCRTQGLNLLVNMFFGVLLNAAYAISSSVLNAVNSFVQAFITAIRPQIYKSYGSNDSYRFSQLIESGTKYTFSILFILCCPVIILTTPILTLWLKQVPEHAVFFVRGFLIVALIDSLSACLITGLQSTGRIRNYQICVGLLTFINLPLSYILFYFKLPSSSMFLSLISISILCLFLRLYFISIQTSFSIRRYIFKVLFPCVLLTVIGFTICSVIYDFYFEYSILSLFLFVLFFCIVNFTLIFSIITSREEKNFIINYLTRKVQ